MANKVIPFPRRVQRPKQRGFVLKAGDLEIAVDISGNALLLRTCAALLPDTQSKVLAIRQSGAKRRSEDLEN